MTAKPIYATGTASVSNGDTVIVGSGTIWSGVNAKAGDTIYVGNAPGVEIKDVTNTTHLALWSPWTGGAQVAAAYTIVQDYPARVVGVAAAEDVGTMLAKLKTGGLPFLVEAPETEPDPSLGADDQYATDPITGEWWLKTGGLWVSQGIFKAFGIPAAWSGATAYLPFDVVTLAGTSYACILAHTNHSPPNATYWVVLAAKGDTGTTGNTGAGYGGTSTTSLLIANSTTKVFTTQAGMAYQTGNYVRASSAANGANFMEGVATYSGTSMSIAVTKIGGSGTFADWRFAVSGVPGAGDLSSAANLSDVANVITARSNLSAASLAAMASRNAVINPAFEVSQELNSSGATLVNNTAKYIVDCWEAAYKHTAATAVVTSFPSGIGGGLPLGQRITATTAITSPASGDFAKYRQKIEGYRIAHWGWGAAGASPIVVAFKIFSIDAGVAFVKLSNSNQSRCYYHEITLTAVDYTFIAFTVPGDTAGTWDSATGIGLTFEVFVSGKETTPQSSLDAWGTGNKVQTTNSVNLLDTNGDLTVLTGVYIDIGTQLPVVADLAGLMRSYDEELTRCRRYFYRFSASNAYVGVAQAYGTGAAFGISFPLPVLMRAAPTASISAPGDFRPYTSAGGASAVFTSITVGGSVDQIIFSDMTGSSGLTAGNATVIRLTAGYVQADARL